jgi:SAM-dependent methyltransferase
MSNFALSSAAQSGFQNASHYDTHRPSYPAEAIDKLLTHLGVAGVEKAHLVDLGSGTGKFTELLARRDERYEIIAVEPHKHMREKCKQKNMSERVQVIDGYAEDIPIEQGWGDAIIAAQVGFEPDSIQELGLGLIMWERT